MQTFVRWRIGENRLARVFPPLQPDHPTYAAPCLACGTQLGNGAPVQLVVLGPGADPEAREKHRTARWYTATAWIMHADCLGTVRADEEAEDTLEWRDV